MIVRSACMNNCSSSRQDSTRLSKTLHDDDAQSGVNRMDCVFQGPFMRSRLCDCRVTNASSPHKLDNITVHHCRHARSRLTNCAARTSGVRFDAGHRLRSSGK
jgi:hypothetical protein